MKSKRIDMAGQMFGGLHITGNTRRGKNKKRLEWEYICVYCLACGINRSLINWKPKVASTTDNVNSPPHYTAGGIECIDAIKASMSKEEYLGYLKGNCIKYLWRYKHKGGAESLAKADWYLQRLRGEVGE